MIPPHPGEILRTEYLEPLKMEPTSLARELLVPPNRITSIINQIRGISEDTALRLAKYFRTTPEYWLDLQRAYSLWKARKAAGDSIDMIKSCSYTPQAHQSAKLRPLAKARDVTERW